MKFILFIFCFFALNWRNLNYYFPLILFIMDLKKLPMTTTAELNLPFKKMGVHCKWSKNDGLKLQNVFSPSS
jgi:hypothetical protein